MVKTCSQWAGIEKTKGYCNMTTFTTSIQAIDGYVAMALRAATELDEAGTKQTSIKLAAWGAALSVQQGLEANGRMVRALVNAGYINQPLPRAYAELKPLFAGKGMFGEAHHKALLRVEELAEAGKLNFMLAVPQFLHEQREQRERAHSLLTGYGFGYKAISMIPLIIAPLQCQVVPIDRHHLARLDCRNSKGKLLDGATASRSSYEAIEQRIVCERLEWARVDVSVCVFAWAMWEAWRKEKAASSKADSEHAESHKNLSARWY